jgi:hypothetical protein
MSFKVLRMQPSIKPLSDTKLTEFGPVDDDTIQNTQSFEMVVESYVSEDDLSPDSIIEVNPEYHTIIIEKYGLTPLMCGVRIDSISDILMETSSPNELFQKEAERIAYSIIAQFEKDTLFNNYNPGKIREYIENKILDLKEKFKIQPK